MLQTSDGRKGVRRKETNLLIIDWGQWLFAGFMYAINSNCFKKDLLFTNKPYPSQGTDVSTTKAVKREIYGLI